MNTAAEPVARRSRVRTTSIGLARAAAPYVSVGALAVLLAFYFLELYKAEFRNPYYPPSGDLYISALFAKTAMKTGWGAVNPDLGAPHRLEMYDFHQAEGLHWIVLWLLGRSGMDVIRVMNLYFLLGFALIAAASLYLFRKLRFPLAPSMAASLLYAFIPQHVLPGQNHLYLVAFYMAPLAVLAMVRLASGERLLAERPAAGRRRLTRFGWFAVVVCIAVGWSNPYHSLFAAMFFAFLGLHLAWRDWNWRRALAPLALAVLVVASMSVSFAPSALYSLRHGPNPEVPARLPVESDLYGLKITQILLPVNGHRIPALARFKEAFNRQLGAVVPNNDVTATLGAVLGSGFLLLLGSVLLRRETTPGDILQPVAALNVAGVLVGTIGGFGSLAAWLLSPQLRCYYRISIFLACFSALGLLAALRIWQERRFAAPRRARLFWGAATVAMLAGLWDEVPLWPPDFHRQTTAAMENDRAFLRRIESAVPPGSRIFQLPYHGFPERGSTHKLLDYHHLRLYMLSDHLRWSYPAMHNRPASEWCRAVADAPAGVLLKRLAEADFRGIYIDRDGYPDRGEQLLQQLASLLPERPFEDGRGRLVFFSLGADFQETGDGLPVRIAADSEHRRTGTHPPEPSHVWLKRHAGFEFRMPAAASRTAAYSLVVEGLSAGRITEVVLNGASLGRMAKPGLVTHRFDLAGILAFDAVNRLEFHTAEAGPVGADMRELGFAVRSALIGSRDGRRPPVFVTALDPFVELAGFHAPENDARWSRGVAAVRLGLAAGVAATGRYHLTLNGTTLPGRPVEVSVNGTRVGLIEAAGVRAVVAFEFPGTLVRPGAVNEIGFRIRRAGPVGPDTRELGYSLASAALRRAR